MEGIIINIFCIIFEYKCYQLYINRRVIAVVVAKQNENNIICVDCNASSNKKWK